MAERMRRRRSLTQVLRADDVDMSVRSRLKLRDTHDELVKAGFYGPVAQSLASAPTQLPRRPLGSKPSGVITATTLLEPTGSVFASSEQAISANAPSSSQPDRHQLSPSILHFLIAAGSLGAFILIIFIVYVSLKIRNEAADAPESGKLADDENGRIDWRDGAYDLDKKRPNEFESASKRLDRTFPMQQASPPRPKNNIATFEQHPGVRTALVRTNSNVSKRERHSDHPPAVARSNSEGSGSGLVDRKLPTLPPIMRAPGSNTSNRELLDRSLPTIPPSVARSSSNASTRERQGLIRSEPRLRPMPSVQTSFYHSQSRSVSSPSSVREIDSISQRGQSPQDSAKHYTGWISGDEAPSSSASSASTMDLKEPLGGNLRPLPPPPPQISRFSWTNSQPQTPRTTRTSARTSVATSIESVPHFRTVNSWVGHQTNRLERQHARGRGTDPRIYDTEEVPIVPEQYRRRSASSGPGQSTPSAFRQHPGQKVIFGEGSRVASEVLDLRIDRL